MHKIRALILDAGGVLVYPVHGSWFIPAAYRELLGSYADDIPGEAWQQACIAEAGLLREDVFVDGIDQEYALRREFLARIAVRLGWQLSEETLNALAEDYTRNIRRYGWYEDVEAGLARLSEKYPIAILSDTMPSFRLVVQAHPCNEYLKSLVFSTEIGAGKPDPKMYLSAAESLGVSPEECLFVDDRAGNLSGAMQVGMAAVQMCREDQTPWSGPAVHNLEELIAYLEGLN